MSKFADKGPSQRQLRVGEEIRHALSDIFLQEDFYDPILRGLSITVAEVRVSPDLRNATAFVAPLGKQPPAGFTDALNAMGSQIRFLVDKRVKLKYSPRLFFKLDDSYEKAHRIEEMLNAVKPEGE